ncbi:MAG: AbrB/MazE/SpoVT family DNA-binding domain-containing protein [Gammaproteobacteria bacterium]
MRVTVKGKVTIPQHIRELAGIRPHSEVEFYFEDGKVWLIRAEADTRSLGSRGQSLVGRLSAEPSWSGQGVPKFCCCCGSQSLEVVASRRRRDAAYPAPPAQIPACGTTAPGSSLILASVVSEDTFMPTRCSASGDRARSSSEAATESCWRAAKCTHACGHSSRRKRPSRPPKRPFRGGWRPSEADTFRMHELRQRRRNLLAVEARAPLERSTMHEPRGGSFDRVTLCWPALRQECKLNISAIEA